MREVKSRPQSNDAVNILGIYVGTMTAESLIQQITQSVESGNRSIFTYLNIHAINLACKTPWLKKFLDQECITYCDGFGLKLGASLLGCKIPERFSVPDWFPQLASACAHQNISMYFLGARPGVAAKAAQRLQDENPTLRILSTHHGYFDKTVHCAENNHVIQLINEFIPDILVIGLGMPLQERWLMENWANLRCLVALPVGAALDYLADEVPRAPRWMTDHGLEWLGRLLVEPRRLWRRYLLGIPSFYINVIRQRMGTYPVD